MSPFSEKTSINLPPAYRSQVLKVTAAIILFIAVYILLMLLSIGIALLFSFGGIKLITFRASFVTGMLGIGMIGLGILVVFFLVKFIFTIKKVDRSGFIEIKKEDQKVFFDYVRSLAMETGSPAPKRIYVSADVNACVFYDSGFLSMFFPIKKNLLVGLGLLNILNISEFKAVLAHEFGHFSQKSMKLGSFVFHVNKIIYNLLFENENYEKTLHSFASASNYFAIFGWLTVKIVQSFQWVLQKVYIVINKANLGLSRQMEFQADSVSALVCGPDHMITALHRLEIGRFCYDSLLSFYHGNIDKGLRPYNMFSQHSEVIHDFCDNNGFEIVNGLPLIKDNYKGNPYQSRISINDKWATHPSTIQRIDYLKDLGMVSEPGNLNSPWTLFHDSGNMQREMTEKVFSALDFNTGPVVLNDEEFKEVYPSINPDRKYNKAFNGYYRNRRINPFLLDSLPENGSSRFKEWGEIFTEENCRLPVLLNVNQSDLQVLDSLQRDKQISEFEFEGKTYTIQEIPEVIKRIEEEAKSVENLLAELDREICAFYLNCSKDGLKAGLIDAYNSYFSAIHDTDASFKRYNDISKSLKPAFDGVISYPEIQATASKVKDLELNIKNLITSVLAEDGIEQIISNQQMQTLKKYLESEHAYCSGSSFRRHELNELNEAMNVFIALMIEREFRFKLKVLEQQYQIQSN